MFTFKNLSLHFDMIKGLLVLNRKGEEERKPYSILNYFVLNFKPVIKYTCEKNSSRRAFYYKLTK